MFLIYQCASYRELPNFPLVYQVVLWLWCDGVCQSLYKDREGKGAGHPENMVASLCICQQIGSKEGLSICPFALPLTISFFIYTSALKEGGISIETRPRTLFSWTIGQRCNLWVFSGYFQCSILWLGQCAVFSVKETFPHTKTNFRCRSTILLLEP